jgi:hypothetical protein
MGRVVRRDTIFNLSTMTRRWVALVVVLVLVVGVGAFLIPSHNSPNSSNYWSFRHIDRRGNLNSVSCPTSSFCMAVSNSFEFTFSGGSWSKGLRINPETGLLDDLSSVSCASENFCVAVGGGYEVTYSGGNWSSRLIDRNSTPQLTSVSCPSSTFCMAVGTEYGDGDAFKYSDGTWSGGQQIDRSDSLTSVSCPNSAFCVAVNGFGDEFTFSNGKWSEFAGMDHNVFSNEIGSQEGLTSVSCPSSRFCVTVDDAGYEFTYTNGSWSHGKEVDGVTNANTNNNLVGVSCANTRFCVTVPQFAQSEIIYSGHRWSKLQPVGPNSGPNWGFSSVSCPQSAFCVATSLDGGDIFTYPVRSGSKPDST